MKTKRILSWLLTLAMLMTLVPSFGITAAAAEPAAAEEPTVIQSSTMENANQAGGVVYTKTSTAKSDGTVDITLTAHTTGEVRQMAAVSPTDIVLVLDVSGSMDDNYTTTRITGYNAVTGGEYTYTTGFWIWEEEHTAYGLESTSTSYYINIGTEEPVYTHVTYTGRDANGFEFYEYSSGNTEVYVYPSLSGTVSATREEAYDVVQFYTATTNTQTVNKMESLQNAVSSFIDTTAQMNTGLETDQMHTISIVKFAGPHYSNDTTNTPTIEEGNDTYTYSNGSNSSTSNYSQVVKGLTPVDSTGATTLKEAVNSLEPAGSTAVDKGLALAQAVLMNRSAVVEEGAVDRNEVVIVFTDGEPNHWSGFDEDVANSAIATAGDMENLADVTVYGVCIDADADATDLDANINKFMHYMSSNYPEATNMDSTESGCDITAGYYMTPDNSTSLSMIFESIIQDIDHPTITMGEEATMVDTLSPYFDFENGDATNVKLQTSARKADGTWADPVDDENLVAVISGDRLTVDGFDFDANYVSETGRGDNNDFYGKQLVVTFTVVPDYGVIDAASATLMDGILPTNSGFASLVDSDSTPAAEVSTPELSTHQVIYKIGDEEYASYNRFTGSDITVDAVPTKEGYTFKGWTIDGKAVAPGDTFTMPEEDVEITGEFTANTYDVTYVYGGTVPANASALPAKAEDVAYGTSVTVAADATAQGYIFSGWAPLEQDVTITNGSFTMPDHSVTLRGVFTPVDNISYTVEHYHETMTDGEYIKHETENKTGVTDTVATAIPKYYDGFTYDEGNANEVISGTISATTPLVLKLYYNRNEYDVTYSYAGDVPAEAPAAPATVKYKYGQSVKVADNVTVAGYTFEGWESLAVTATAGETFTMPAQSVAFIGAFSANSDTEYKVEYYLENLAGDGYDLDADASYTNTAVTGTTVYANNREFAGFTFDADNANNKLSGTVAGDGSLVLKLYYTRNTYTVAYEYDGTQPAGAPVLPVDNNTYKYGATVTVAGDLVLEGYVFDGWYPTNLAIEVNGTFVMPAENVNLLGNFEPSAGIPWKEEHYFQNVDGTYPTETEYVTNHTGTTGETASAVSMIMPGYTFDEDNADNVTSAVIVADGSTTLKFYYERNTYNVTYEYIGTQPENAPELPEGESNVMYGAQVEVADGLTLGGYTFEGWTVSVYGLEIAGGMFEMPDSDVVFRGRFVNGATTYTVEHYTETLAGGYELHDFNERGGVTGETATGATITISGYTFDEDNAENVTSAVIAADGSTTLKFYYNLNTYDVVYMYDGIQPSGVPALPDGETEVKVGETVTVKPDLAMTGYRFVGWYTADLTIDTTSGLFAMPDHTVTLLGRFEPSAGTMYKEIHYLQNLDGTYDNAEVYYEKEHYGTTNETASASRMNPTGFTFDTDAENIENAPIDANGTTVLKFHYKRNEYKVTYKYEPAEQPDGAADLLPAEETYLYGETVTVEDIPEITGYTFIGWNPEQSGIPASGTFTMPADDVVFEGDFDPRSDTKYEVHHHLQKADGTYPEAPDYVNTHTGTTGIEVTAQPRNFAGYTLASTDPVKGIVKADGTLVLDLFYNRNEYTVTYYITGRVPAGVTAPVDTNSPYRHGEEVTVLPTLYAEPGITFVGWTPVAQSSEDATVTINGGKFTMPMHNVRLEGRFSANSGIPYVVRHWTQKETLDGYEIYTSDRRVGTTGDTVIAYAFTIPGFTDVTDYKNGTAGQLEAEILGDGTLVIDFYYDRNAYDVTYVYEGIAPADAPAAPVAVNDVRYGTEVTVADAPAVPGYTFNGWTTTDATVNDGKFDMPDNNVTLKGSFASNLVDYKVNFWLQNSVGNDYTLLEDVQGTGYTYKEQAYVGQLVQARNQTFTGFTLNQEKSEWQNYVTVDKDGNGNLVLNLYFDRHTYNVSYVYYGEQPAGAPDISDRNITNVRYGTTVEVAVKPELEGYIFDGWYTRTATVQDNKFTMPDHDVTILGLFVKGYNVSYDLNGGTGAEGVDYSTKKVAEGENVTVNAAPTRNGYTFKGWNDEITDFNPGDVVTVYSDVTFTAKWSRNGGGGGGSSTVYTLTYDTNGGNKIANEKYNPGAVVELEKVPVKEGYVFDGWHMDEALSIDTDEVTMTKNITVYADWVADNGNAGNGHATPDSLNGDDHFAYVVGYPDGTVKPNNNISRAEVTSIFFRLLKAEVRDDNLAEYNSFNDVSDADWYNTAVSTMTGLGIVKGRTADSFVPDAFITRAEFAAICARFDDSEFEVIDNFSDVDGHWAANEIHEAAAHGWIRGYEDNTFKPDRYITRAEAMTMINRVLNRVPETADDLLDGMIKWPDNSNESVWYYIPVQEATNSHKYDMKNNVYEKWTTLQEVTDWTKYEY